MQENKSIHPNGRKEARMQQAGKPNPAKAEKLAKHRAYLMSCGFNRTGRK